jgi:hypothetical protein
MLNLMKHLLAYKPNSTFVPCSVCEPYSTFVPSFVLILVSSSSDVDSADENPPLPTHLSPDDSNELEPTTIPSLPRWVYSTREVVGDPSNQLWKISQL